MKLNKFIINSIGIIILMIFILYICLVFHRITFIKNDEISEILDTNIVKQINDESIDPYKIVKPYDYFASSNFASSDFASSNFTSSDFTSSDFASSDFVSSDFVSSDFASSKNKLILYEPFIEGATMLGSGNNSADLRTIENMREFLEKMYLVTAKNEIENPSDSSYNFCRKFAEIASTLPAAISDFRKNTREKMDELYSSKATPTQPPGAAPCGAGQPQPIAIIQNNNDYVQLLSLCVRSKFLEAYVLPSVNINTKLDRKIIDGYGKIDAIDLGVVDSANALFIPIRNILNYFHNQLTKNSDITPGDTAETASLSLQDSCASNALSYKIKEYKQPGSFTDTVPAWAGAIQILIIGAGGGGGGGAPWCDTGARGQWSGGGGGGAGGNTGAILYTTEKLVVSPNTTYTVQVGDGGAAGVRSDGGRGGDTLFAINNSFVRVKGASGGSYGREGRCGRNNSHNQWVVSSMPNSNPMIDGGINGFKYIMKGSIPGNTGDLANVNPGRGWNCTRGQGGKGNYIDKLPELKGPMFPKLQKKYGYSGNGGSGQNWDSMQIYKDQPLPISGSAGGSGYVCVFLFAN